MQEFSKVYLDFNATTPLSERVRRRLHSALEFWGNPSSIHWAGREIKTELREARKNIARALNCSPLELIFTSGASESNNSVLQGLAQLLESDRLPLKYKGRDEFITSCIEHPSVSKVFDELEARGFRVHRIPVSREGRLDLEAFARVLSEKTLLVSMMWANNETGSLLPLPEITRLAHERGALVHTDAVQSLGKLPVNLEAWGVDYASFSAHKFYSLKGTGLLYVRKGSPYQSLIFGGAQERSRRGGTENTLGQMAMGESVLDLDRLSFESERLGRLRDRLERRILTEIADCHVTGAGVPRVPNTSSLILDGVDGETLLMSLDLRGFAVSTGAACSSGSPEPSPVLLAMGLEPREAQNSLRVSLGWTNTEAQVDLFVETLKEVVAHLRRIAREDEFRQRQMRMGE